MNNEELIQKLQDLRIEEDRVIQQLINNSRQSRGDLIPPSPPTQRDRSLHSVGDRVRITNAVRVKGSVIPKRNVRGTVVKLTASRVHVRLDETQEIVQRAPSNVAREPGRQP